VHDDFAEDEHHRVLLANMVAQAGALAFAAQRPSNTIILDRLDPYHLGMLLALYEHKVFVQSVIWNINPFDQPGVELGKKLAGKLLSGEGQSDPAQHLMMELYQSLQKMR
jgi:glucose-6-phosphate isomerase